MGFREMRILISMAFGEHSHFKNTIREAGIYIENNAKKGSTVGLALSPSHVFPPIKDFKASLYEDDRIYDYVVVNYYNIIREGFDEKKIKEKYKPIYFVKAQEAILVTVYKRK